MNPFVGWALAALALAAGWRAYGMRGLALGASVIVFWLVLQFNRSLRAMRNAAHSPVGYVDSAVMLNAKLRTGMLLLQVVELTKSLGRRVAPEADVFAWADPGQAEVVVTFVKGRCQSWVLHRPAETAEQTAAEQKAAE